MNTRLGMGMILLAAACFGTLGIFGKLGFESGLNVPTLLTFRFLLASAALGGYLVVTGRGGMIRGRSLHIAIALGVAHAVLAGGFFAGLVYIPAGLAAITLYTFPVYVYLFAVVVLGERLSWLKLVAIALALGGVGAIFALDLGAVDLRGILLVSLAAVAYAVYTTGSREAVATIDADVLAAVAVAVTAVAFLGIGLATGTLFVPEDTEQWGIVAGLAIVGTAAPIVLFVHGLRLVEASQASILAMAEPPVTVVLGVILLGEALTAGLLVGGGMILLGIVLIQRDAAVARPAAGPADGADR